MELTYKAVLFDLDGTLMDSEQGIQHSLAAAFTQMGFPFDPYQRCWIGQALHQSLTEHGVPDLEASECVSIYRAHYNREGIYENRLYPGVHDLLHDLVRAGAYLAVATTKPKLTALFSLEKLEIMEFFDVICAAPMEDKTGDKYRRISDALRFAPSPAVMIGDRKFDVIGAKSANISCIGVVYGYGDREELVSAGANQLAEDISELRGLLFEGE